MNLKWPYFTCKLTQLTYYTRPFHKYAFHRHRNWSHHSLTLNTLKPEQYVSHSDNIFKCIFLKILQMGTKLAKLFLRIQLTIKQHLSPAQHQAINWITLLMHIFIPRHECVKSGGIKKATKQILPWSDPKVSVLSQTDPIYMLPIGSQPSSHGYWAVQWRDHFTEEFFHHNSNLMKI